MKCLAGKRGSSQGRTVRRALAAGVFGLAMVVAPSFDGAASQVLADEAASGILGEEVEPFRKLPKPKQNLARAKVAEAKKEANWKKKTEERNQAKQAYEDALDQLDRPKREDETQEEYKVWQKEQTGKVNNLLAHVNAKRAEAQWAGYERNVARNRREELVRQGVELPQWAEDWIKNKFNPDGQNHSEGKWGNGIQLKGEEALKQARQAAGDQGAFDGERRKDDAVDPMDQDRERTYDPPLEDTDATNGSYRHHRQPDLNQTNSAARLSVSQANGNHQSSGQTTSAVQSQYERDRADFERQVADFTTHLAQYETDVENHNQKVKSLDSRSEMLAAQTQALGNEQESHNSDVERHDREVAKHNRELKALEPEASAYGAECDRQGRAVDVYNNEAGAYERDVYHYNSLPPEKRTKFKKDQLDRWRERLEARKNELNSWTRRLQTQQGDLRQRAAYVDSRARQLESEKQRIDERAENLNSRKDSLQRRYRELEAEGVGIDKSGAKLDERKAQLKRRRSDLLAVENDLARRRTELARVD